MGATSERRRLGKAERRERILLELRLRPHVRTSELAERFGVSAETLRRDVEALSHDGLIARAHGGASPVGHRHYPGFDERTRDRIEERERIGRRAAALVGEGEAVMIDSGSTTLQAARFLALAGTRCTVITNSLPVALALGQSEPAEVILCPGDMLASESAVIGTDAVEYLTRYRVDRCLIGASGLTEEGPSESVRGFADIKRAMLARSGAAHLLIDGDKFGRAGLAQVGPLAALASVVTDRAPGGALADAMSAAKTQVLLAG